MTSLRKLLCLLLHRRYWLRFARTLDADMAHCQRCGAMWSIPITYRHDRRRAPRLEK